MSTRRPDRSCMSKLMGPVKLNLLLAMRSSKGADYLAGGLALGAFWVWTPITFLHYPVAYVLARWLHVSKLAAIAAVTVSNPLTLAPLQFVNAVLGVMVTPGGDPDSVLRNPGDLFSDPANIFDVSLHDYFILCAGSVVTGTVTALFVWAIARRWAWAMTRRRQRRHLKAAQRIAMAATAHHGPRPEDSE